MNQTMPPNKKAAGICSAKAMTIPKTMPKAATMTGKVTSKWKTIQKARLNIYHLVSFLNQVIVSLYIKASYFNRLHASSPVNIASICSMVKSIVSRSKSFKCSILRYNATALPPSIYV
jgi:hypothetical protein